jgi:hypothetical protein
MIFSPRESLLCESFFDFLVERKNSVYLKKVSKQLSFPGFSNLFEIKCELIGNRKKKIINFMIKLAEAFITRFFEVAQI